MSDVAASGVGVTGTYGYGYPNNTAGTFAFNPGSGKSGWSLSPTLTAFPNPGFPTPPPTSPPPATNLALHQPTAESSHTQVYGSGNAVDGDKNAYWESANNAFPQWCPVDLGSATSVGRLVLDLPPSSAWGTRTQTGTVSGSADGSNVTTLKASAGYTPDPSTGNTATGTFPAATVRYLRLTFTANTGWPVGQLSEREAYAS